MSMAIQLFISICLYLLGFWFYSRAKMLHNYWSLKYNLERDLTRAGVVGTINILASASVIYGIYLAFRIQWWLAIIVFIVGKVIVNIVGHKNELNTYRRILNYKPEDLNNRS